MPAAIAGAGSVPRFSLTTIVAGNWLWVEELPAIPLAREQVQLVQAMALAMGRVSAIEASNARSNTPDIAQFDWPMHTNEQLDLGEDAAAAALTSFLRRRLDSGDLALVLLGQGAANRVPLGQLSCKHLVLGHTSADLISRPELKKQAWAELKSFLGSC
jgi:hypothetical protein